MLLMSATACAGVDWPEMKGKVLDAKTDQSVSGAIIVARWKGWGAYTTGICFHVESTTTDDRGHFEIPAWTNTGEYRGLKDQQVDITAYKPGYQLSPRQIEEQSHLTGIYYIEPVDGPIEERLEYLQKISRTTGCNSAGESEKNLLLLRKALYAEAEQLAKVKKDKKTLEDLLYSKEIIELGYETAQKRHLERLGAQ